MSSQAFYTIVSILFAIVVATLGVIYNKISDSSSSKFRAVEEKDTKTKSKVLTMGKRKIDIQRANKVKRRGWFKSDEAVDSPKEFKVISPKGEVLKNVKNED